MKPAILPWTILLIASLAIGVFFYKVLFPFFQEEEEGV